MSNFKHIYNQIPKKSIFPSSKNENWRYFNLQRLKEKLNQTEYSRNDFLINYIKKETTHLKIDNESIFLNKNLPKGISIDIINPENFNLLNSKILKRIGTIASIDSNYFISENTEIKYNAKFI